MTSPPPIAPELLAQLKRDEDARHQPGRRFYPYRDRAGHLTIGWGRNLDARGISESEAEALLTRDAEETTAALLLYAPWTAGLDPVRRAVLVNMAFNLGLAGLLEKNPRMLAAAQAGEWAEAAREMLSGPWAEQVGERAVRLARQMAVGEWA